MVSLLSSAPGKRVGLKRKRTWGLEGGRDLTRVPQPVPGADRLCIQSFWLEIQCPSYLMPPPQRTVPTETSQASPLATFSFPTWSFIPTGTHTHTYTLKLKSLNRKNNLVPINLNSTVALAYHHSWCHNPFSLPTGTEEPSYFVPVWAKSYSLWLENLGRFSPFCPKGARN